MDPLEDLYRTEHQRLWRSLVAFCGDRDLATEAEAEAFSQLVHRGDGVRDPKAWLWRAAFRIAGGLLAERNSRSRHLSSLESIDHGGSPATGAVVDDSLAEFLDLLQSLSEQQRAVVVLRYAGGLTPTDIAELLGTSPGTIRVQLHRAHHHLREGMDAR
ncbi:MAG: sigma-70 family RNA polymerase sigma factor [Actinomycetota bacterium]